jgi:glucose-1-phosphate cytidylyltransferase
VLSDVDLDDLRTFHDEQGRLVTVTAVQPNSPFGHLVIDEANRVKGFQEKPRLTSWVNIGFAVLERPVFQRLAEDSPQLEAGLFPEMAAGEQLSAFRHFGSFEPMDSYADYRRLNKMQDAGELEWIGGNPEAVR